LSLHFIFSATDLDPGQPAAGKFSRIHAWFSRGPGCWYERGGGEKRRKNGGPAGDWGGKESGAALGEADKRTFLERGSPSHLQLSPVLRNSPKQPLPCFYSHFRANQPFTRFLTPQDSMSGPVLEFAIVRMDIPWRGNIMNL
jgi:hypothetical protein